jgi:uncharacterized protein (TIGR03437 family)
LICIFFLSLGAAAMPASAIKTHGQAGDAKAALRFSVLAAEPAVAAVIHRRVVRVEGPGLSATVGPGGLTVLHPNGMPRSPEDGISIDWASSGAAGQFVRGTSAVGFRAILPGIDVVFYDAEGTLEYDFTIHPGADPSSIRLTPRGVRRVEVLANGDLRMEGSRFAIIQRKPFAYQRRQGAIVAVEAEYRIAPSGELGFALGAYDREAPLVIDPVIEYATTFGNGASQPSLHDVKTTPDGSVILFGATSFNVGDLLLPGEPTPPKYLVAERNLRGHLTRFSAGLGAAIRTVRLGFVNTNSLAPRLLAIGPDGSVYAAQGYTDSSYSWEQPAGTTTGPFGALVQPPLHGSHLRSAVLKASPDLETLGFAAIIRCTGEFVIQAMAVTPANELVIAGRTSCADFPVSAGAYSRPGAPGDTQLFLARFRADGTAMPFATVFGGAGFEEVGSLEILPSGDYAIAGLTRSPDFPVTAGTLRSTGVYDEGFVTVVSADGTRLVASTLAGGSSTDRVTHLIALPDGDLLLGIQTSSQDLPVTPGAYGQHGNDGGALARVSSDLKTLRFLTYIPAYMLNSDLAVDEAGDYWVAGTRHNNNPDPEGAEAPPLARRSAGFNNLLFKLRSDGRALLFFTPWFGQSGNPRFGAVRSSTAEVFTLPADPITLPSNAPRLSNGSPGSEFREIHVARVNVADPTRCAVSVDTPERTVSHRGGTGVFRVTAPAGCPWIAIDDRYSSVLASLSVAGFGNGEVPYTVRPNPSSQAAESFDLSINGQPLRIDQPATPCTEWTLSADRLDFTEGGGVRSLTVETAQGCTIWHRPGAAWAVTNLPPLPFLSGGSHSFTVSVPPNAFAARQTAIRVLDREIPIAQQGGVCTATVTPSESTLPASGGDVTLQIVTSSPGCNWTAASVDAAVSFTDPPSGTGARSLRIRIAANPGNQPRQISVVVAGQSVAIQQEAGVCTVRSISDWIDVPRQGGEHFGNLSAEGANCAPVAVSGADWIFPLPAASVPQGQFGFKAVPNLSGATRRAQISVLGRTVTIQQFARPTTVIVMTGGSGIPYRVNDELRTLPSSFLMETGVPFTIEAPERTIDALERIVEFHQWESLSADRRITVIPEGDYHHLRPQFRFYFPFKIQYKGNPASGGGTVTRTGGAVPFFSTATADYYSAPGTVTLTATDGANARFVRFEGAYRSPNRTVNVPTIINEPLVAVFESSGAAVAMSKPSLALIAHTGAGAANPNDSVQIASASAQIVTLGSPIVNCPAPIPAGAVTATLSGASTPAILTVQAITAQLQAVTPEIFACTVTVPGAQQEALASVPLRLEVRRGSSSAGSRMEAIVEGAGFRAVAVAPGSIASVFGTGLATASVAAESVPLPVELDGTRLSFRSGGSVFPAALFYVSPHQVNLLVPPPLGAGVATLELHRNGALVHSMEVNVATSAPSLFAANADGKGAPAGFAIRVNGASQQRSGLFQCSSGAGSCVPALVAFGNANEQVFLELYGTGFRNLPGYPTATVNGFPVNVTYMGAHGQFAGLDQINLQIPRWMQGMGLAELELQANGESANKLQVRF